MDGPVTSFRFTESIWRISPVPLRGDLVRSSPWPFQALRSSGGNDGLQTTRKDPARSVPGGLRPLVVEVRVLSREGVGVRRLALPVTERSS